MKYRVEHVTRVRYTGGIRQARFNIRLQPATWPGQEVSDFTLEIEPRPQVSLTVPGPYPFHWTRIEIDEPIDTLTIRTRFLAVAEDRAPGDGRDPTIAEVGAAALAIADTGRWSPANYLFNSPLLARVPEIAAWAAPHLPPGAPVLASGLALARRIQTDFAYDPDATEADTTVEQAFAGRHGVCQDFAHVLIAAFRSAGLPAAYVSGYLRTVPPPGKPRLVGVDAMHAWVALWCGPQAGWVGLDPTNGCITGSGHIFAALGRDYSDVSPIDGIFVGGASQILETSVDVMPLEA